MLIKYYQTPAIVYKLCQGERVKKTELSELLEVWLARHEKLYNWASSHNHGLWLSVVIKEQEWINWSTKNPANIPADQPPGFVLVMPQ